MTEAAADLTRIARENAKRRAVKIAPDAAAYNEFAAGFPFSETPDQARATAYIALVCGNLALAFATAAEV